MSGCALSARHWTEAAKMAYNIHSLVSEAKRNKLSLITSLTEEDVMVVWEATADFIERLMLQHKVRERSS